MNPNIVQIGLPEQIPQYQRIFVFIEYQDQKFSISLDYDKCEDGRSIFTVSDLISACCTKIGTGNYVLYKDKSTNQSEHCSTNVASLFSQGYGRTVNAPMILANNYWFTGLFQLLQRGNSVEPVPSSYENYHVI